MRILGAIVVIVFVAIFGLAISMEDTLSLWKGIVSLLVIILMFVVLLGALRGL